MNRIGWRCSSRAAATPIESTTPSAAYGASVASLLDAAFRVADDEGNRFTLPQAIRLVTKNPASALNLQDRGEIAEGKRADLVLAHRRGEHVHIDHVWRQGKRVF